MFYVSPENPARCLRRSREEPQAFAGFYNAYFEAILTFLARRALDPEVALDLTAETFAQAFVARSRFRGTAPEQAQAWIYRIARRQLSRYLRRGRLERRALTKLGVEVPALDDERRTRIEELADLAGARRVLDVEMARLSTAQSDALALRIIDELPYSEVATRLEISEQAARLRVSRGLRTLTKALEANSTLKELRA